MQDQQIITRVLDNGLTLLIEPMRHVQSAAFAILVPGGSIYDPPQQNGSASVLSEFLFRGAGDYDSRELSTALDNLGVSYSSGPRTAHLAYSGATLAANIRPALQLFSEMVRRPHLPADQFEASRNTVMQTLMAKEDEPQQKIFTELKQRCYDAPFGLPIEGNLAELPNLSADSLRDHYERCFRPNDTIIAVAGNVETNQITDLVDSLFGDWEMKTAPDYLTAPHGPSIDHINHDSEQTHIGIAYETVPQNHPEYYTAWATVSVLSGGMSARLFTEVREKRALCYSIYGTMHSTREEGRVLCYAGTSADRAQETLNVTLQELQRLKNGIEQHELDRCKARAKSSLIMAQESTSRRAGTLASHWDHFNRVIPLEEIQDKINALTVDSLLAFIHEHPARNFTVLTIGPAALEVPHEVS